MAKNAASRNEQSDGLWAALPNAEKIAIIAACALLIGGALLAAGANWIDVTVEEGATIVALVLVPLIANGLVSGRILEFTAPGGWSAKFKEAANAPVESVRIGDAVEDLQFVTKQSVAELARAGHFDPREPVALRLELKSHAQFLGPAIIAYIKKLSTVDPAMTIVLTDNEGRFVASAPGSAVERMLEDESTSATLVSALNAGGQFTPTGEPGFTTDSLDEDTTNIEALEKMQRANVLTMVVVDKRNHPVGIVRRDHIVAQLLVYLAKRPGA